MLRSLIVRSTRFTTEVAAMNIEQLFIVLITLAPIFGIFALLAAIAEFWEWLEDRADK